MGVLARFVEREPRSLENPSSSVMQVFAQGAETESGVTINEDTALNISAVYACVRVISETLGSLPFHVYKRLEPRGRERVPDHPLYWLLHLQPNPEMTSMQWRETIAAHVVLRGNSYSEIEYDRKTGNIKALWPLRPDQMTVKRQGGRLWYHYQLNGVNNILSDDQILHVPGLGYDGIIGYSVVAKMRETMGLAQATEKFGSGFFGRGAKPSGVFVHPQPISPTAKKNVRESIEEQIGGLSKSNRILILEEGMKWEQIGMNNDDSQFLETRKFQLAEIARPFRVPLHLLQDLERATFCLPGDSEVFTEDGPKTIVDVIKNEKVWSLNEKGWTLSRVLKCANTGNDEILIIKTTNRTIKCNTKHPILVRVKSRYKLARINKSGAYYGVKWSNQWIPAGLLKAGDTMVTLNELPDNNSYQCPTRKATEQFMEFCGLLIGDGNINHQNGIASGVSIARADNASYMDYYRKAMVSEFVQTARGGRGKATKRRTQKITLQEAPRQTRFSSVLAGGELERLGFSGTAHTKTMPGWIFKLTTNLKLAFLRGFLDADGTVNTLGRIRYDSVNKKMLSQIRHLCMDVGIPVTNTRCQEGITTLPNGKNCQYKSYCFTCSDPGENRRIGSHDPRYIERLNNGKPFKRKGRKYPRHGGRGFGLKGCGLSRIVSIEKSTTLEPIYNLAVENTHSFIADGIVVHNSNIEHMGIDFVRHCIRPWAERHEQAFQVQLFRSEERKIYFCKHLLDGLLRGDVKARYDSYKTGHSSGWLSANEIRELEDMNPIPKELGGDAYLVPLNIAPLSLVASGGAMVQTAQRALNRSNDSDVLDADFHEVGLLGNNKEVRGRTERQKLASVFTPLFIDAGQRIVNREAIAIRKALEKFFGERDASQFAAWLEGFYGKMEPHVLRTMQPVITSYSEAVLGVLSGELEITAEVYAAQKVFNAGLANSYTRRHIGSSLGQLREILKDSSPQDVRGLMKTRLDEWIKGRPSKIASNEIVQIRNATAQHTFSQMGVKKKRWVAYAGACAFCMSLNGVVTEIEAPFVRGGDTIRPTDEAGNALTDDNDKPLEMVVHRSRLHPPIHRNCSCDIQPE